MAALFVPKSTERRGLCTTFLDDDVSAFVEAARILGGQFLLLNFWLLAPQLPNIPHSGSAAQKLLAWAHSIAAWRIVHVQAVIYSAAEAAGQAIADLNGRPSHGIHFQSGSTAQAVIEWP
jgi:hypothetical protein